MPKGNIITHAKKNIAVYQKYFSFLIISFLYNYKTKALVYFNTLHMTTNSRNINHKNQTIQHQ